MTYRVEVDGLALTLKRLRDFDEVAYRDLISGIEDAMGDIADDAKQAFPSGNALGNWGGWSNDNVVRRSRSGAVIRQTMRKAARDLSYDGGRVRSKVQQRVARKYRRGAMVGAVAQVVQTDAAGAIFALAGSKNEGNPFAVGGSATFTQNMNDKHLDGPWPRAMGPAWTRNVDKARRVISDLVNAAARRASS